MNEIVNQEDFPLFNTSSPIGIHSIRNLPATYSRKNGHSKEDVDTRRRWKSNKRIVDTYIDCLIAFSDVKVASTLCIFVSTKCEVSEEFTIVITKNKIKWSKYFKFLSQTSGSSFGRVIIWATYDVEICKLMDANIVARIKSFIPVTESTIELITRNPVTNVALVVGGYEEIY